MHNIASIFRFRTPFLDLEKEKKNLLSVLKKIEKSLEFDGISFKKYKEKIEDYYKINLVFDKGLGNIEIFYINTLDYNNILPLFKLNISISSIFLVDNKSKTKAVKFLNNIFECFDGLDEKEYLIDLDNNFYYKNGFFGSKKYPNYDFLDINIIQQKFEGTDGIKIMEDFIYKLKKENFILTKENAHFYYNFYAILMYLIYLVYLMYQNVKKTSDTLKNIKEIEKSGIYELHYDLMKKRLNYLDDLNLYTYKKYKEKLDIFFSLID